VVTGLSGGVLAQFTKTITLAISPIMIMGRPTWNHIVPNFKGRKNEYAKARKKINLEKMQNTILDLDKSTVDGLGAPFTLAR
jgi:dihydrofolate reductase